MLLLFLANLFIANTDTCNKLDTCEKCLKQCYETHFWCLSDNKCRPLDKTTTSPDGTTNPFGTCRFYESHDLVFNATECCATKSDYNTCVKGQLVSYCEWCTSPPLCLYKYHKSNDPMMCEVPPESFSKCSNYTTCGDCKNNILCVWCEDNSRCVPKDSQMDENSKYKCNRIAADCCFDYKTCSECSANSNTFDNQECVWCSGEKECKHVAAALSTCSSVNRFGANYCDDRCYSRSSNCTHCVSDIGCVWVSKMSWAQSINVPTDIDKMCVAGTLSGPKSRIINYVHNGTTTPYQFIVQEFYYMNCSLKSSALITTISLTVVGVVLLILLILAAVTIAKRIKYAKALRSARKEAAIINNENDDQEDSDEAECNEIARLIKPVSWE